LSPSLSSGCACDSLPSEAHDIATLQLNLGDLTPQRGGNTGGFVALSPDGRRIVVAARHATEERGQQRLYQRTLDRREFSAVSGTEDSSNLSVSPDGQWVAFESHGQLKKVSFGGGVPIPVCDVPGVVGGTTWADNDTIVFASQRQLFQVSAAGGRPSPITASRSDDAGYVWPSAIPGRHAVLRHSAQAAARARVFAIVAVDLSW
jgi:Tol biopolymer transport system component